MSDKQKPSIRLPDGKVVAESLSRITQTGRKLVSDYLGRQARGEQAPPEGGAVVGKAFLELSQKMLQSPQKMIEIQMGFWKDNLARDDYIAPWKTTYLGTQLVRGPVRFVLGGSGHIAGVINPAGSKKYGYATNAMTPKSADDWLAGATTHDGSWRPDWLAWLAPSSGVRVPARQPGRGALRAIEDAPGSFVRVRH